MDLSTLLTGMPHLLPSSLPHFIAVVSLVAPAAKPSGSAEPGKEKDGVESSSPPSSAKVIRIYAEDREFLPAALELIDTPPSPILVFLIWLVCAFFAAALAWSWFGHLDIHAVASGKIHPSGESKVVQPLDLGKVVAVHVKNGSVVKQGDLLVELDSTETSAEMNALAVDVEAADAEVARRRAAIASAGAHKMVPIEFAAKTSESVRAREQGVLEADVGKLMAGEDTLKAQLAQARSTIQRLADGLEQREAMIDIDKELVDMRETLMSHGTGSRALVIEAQQRYFTDLVTQVTERGQLRETQESANAIERKINELEAQFLAEQSDKLGETQRKRDHTLEDLIKARSKNTHAHLTAPVDGVVQQLSITSIGQVVTSGQALMTIVPNDAPVEITAMVLNSDIGFLQVGQSAVVKIDAFPFTRYGTIIGTVKRISPDAVDMRSAPNLSEAAALVKPQNSSLGSGSDRPQLAFPTTIALERDSINVDGKEIRLSPGMSVIVEIKTGSRRVIDYLLSPLREVVSQSAHER
jgi:hemolysin D